MAANPDPSYCAAPTDFDSAACVELLVALQGAVHALRSYQYGNASPDLAASVADHCTALIARMAAR